MVYIDLYWWRNGDLNVGELRILSPYSEKLLLRIMTVNFFCVCVENKQTQWCRSFWDVNKTRGREKELQKKKNHLFHIICKIFFPYFQDFCPCNCSHDKADLIAVWLFWSVLDFVYFVLSITSITYFCISSGIDTVSMHTYINFLVFLFYDLLSPFYVTWLDDRVWPSDESLSAAVLSSWGNQNTA